MAGSTSPAERGAGGGSGPEPGTDAAEQQRCRQQPSSYAEAATTPAEGGARRDATVATPLARPTEDVEAALITMLNSAFPDLGLQRSDIERVHRTGKKIWCRFVKSGAGSKRDQLYNGRLSLRDNRKGNELYISECLTKARQELFAKLLAYKKDKKIYTVFTRYGSVFVKEQQYGRNIRVDDASALTALGVDGR